MIFVKGGRFTMGSSIGGANTTPEHPVVVSNYCLDRTEVTVAEYYTCPGTTCAAPLKDVGGLSPWCDGDLRDPGNLPVNCVRWDQADTWCRWTGRTLPTSAQWEFAARGTQNRAFAWGNELPAADNLNRLNACDGDCAKLLRPLTDFGDAKELFVGFRDGYPTLAPVGSFEPTGLGFHDLAGNVGEWVQDYWGPYRESAEPLTDPVETTPDELHARVKRLGDWTVWTPTQVSAFWRQPGPPDEADARVGFRCAIAAEVP